MTSGVELLERAEAIDEDLAEARRLAASGELHEARQRALAGVERITAQIGALFAAGSEDEAGAVPV